MDPYPGTSILLIPEIPELLIPLLILLAALLTAGRTALTQLRDGSVKKMALSERRNARFIARLLQKPAAFLDGLKLAGFACSLAAGMLLYLWGRTFLLLQNVSFLPALLLQLLLPAAIILLLDVLCSLLPYRVACRHPDGAAAALARLCWLAACLFHPLVLLNTSIARALAVLFGVRGGEEPEEATEEEIRMMVDVGSEKGSIEQSEKDMINNIFEFDDRSVSEVMTHRTDMTAAPKNTSLGEIARLAIESGFSRIPIYDDDVDAILGIIYVKDLLCLIDGKKEPFVAENYMRPALFVPENMSCVDLFSQFKLKKMMVAIAVDEYGGTAGIVTMEDLLESIVGSIQDEYDDEEEEVSPLAEGGWSLDGAVSLDEVERLFHIELEEDTDCDTIGGLLIERLGHIPASGEHPAVTLEGVTFTVQLVEDRRVARVKAVGIPPEGKLSDDEK